MTRADSLSVSVCHWLSDAGLQVVSHRLQTFAAMQATFAGIARRRTALLLSSSRQFSLSACRRAPDSGDSAPKPPPPIDDSTSALDYKRRTTLQHRPPPLPVIDVRSRSAEEAVTNILYNTPPPSLAPFKKCGLRHHRPLITS